MYELIGDNQSHGLFTSRSGALRFAMLRKLTNYYIVEA